MPLKPDDNCGQAMTMMSIYRIGDMPVVSDGKLLGLVSEEEISSVETDTLISTFRLNQSYIFASQDDHIFDILGKLAENRISVIPVLDNEEKYLGLITQEQLLTYYANTYAFKERGSIIVIKTSKSDYSLSEITRVIEMEGAIIMASFTTTEQKTSNLLVTLKINQQEISSIITALERYEYDIHATFSEDSYESDLKSRYDLLMTYLNV